MWRQTDAKINYNVDKIVMPKNVMMIQLDGVKVDITKWMVPVNNRTDEKQGDRSDRPSFDVEETIDSYVYRLEVGNNVDDNVELEDSVNSLEEEHFTLNI